MMYTNFYRASAFVLLASSFLSESIAYALPREDIPPQVKLGGTSVVGIQTALDQEYLGIPFAEPPIGNLRFAQPILKTSLQVETFNATEFGPACLQADDPELLGHPTSEDCLTINIFRPAGLPLNATVPVMVWIYGGGFVGGSTFLSNGSEIISRSISRDTPVIYVNFNYRLGPLGFLQGDEAMVKGALNLGLRDQITALEWIQTNIHAFGGDKSRVTLFGESAGSISVSTLMLNENIAGSLFRAAILESGVANSPLLFNASRRQDVWDNFVRAVPECASLVSSNDTFGCLRNASSTEILAAWNVSLSLANEQFPWVPVIDGSEGLIPALPSELYTAGAFPRVPFIAGTNLDEGTGFTPMTIDSSDTIREWIITNHSTTQSPSEIAALGEAADRLLELYPDDPALASPFNTGNETFGLSSQFKRLAAMTGDLHLQCIRRQFIQVAASHNVTAYGYLFTEPPPQILILFGVISPALGVFHGSELLYIYPDVVSAIVGSGVELANPQLSEWMLDYWLSFATSLDPNDGKGSNRPLWEQYNPQNQMLLQLNDQNTTMIPS